MKKVRASNQVVVSVNGRAKEVGPIGGMIVGIIAFLVGVGLLIFLNMRLLGREQITGIFASYVKNGPTAKVNCFYDGIQYLNINVNQVSNFNYSTGALLPLFIDPKNPTSVTSYDSVLTIVGQVAEYMFLSVGAVCVIYYIIKLVKKIKNIPAPAEQINLIT